MYGIILWLSERGQSALIVIDGGRTLAFGRCLAEQPNTFEVGDLVYAKGLSAGQDKFDDGITLVLAGFWPEVRQVIDAHHTVLSCHLVKKSGNLGQTVTPIAADNLASAPNDRLGKKFGRKPVAKRPA